MVNFAKLSVGTTVLAAQLALGAPQGVKRDSSLGDEVGVSAPYGTPLTDTMELASQLSAEASSSTVNMYATTTANAYMTQGSYDTANSWDTTSALAYDTMSTAAVYDTTSVAQYNTYNTDAMSTSSAYQSTATYGSGSVNWGSSGYNDCVQQCIASFGAPAATYTPPSSTYSGSSSDSSSGSGATHTIIVAPTQGVLRYVPFATNASVGDTIKFVWNANTHTVTQGSEVEICNATNNAFVSGVQNKSFVFTQTVNSTNSTFFHCSVPTHCQKGMFGIINPPNADSAMNVNSMMPSLVSNSSEVSAWNSYTSQTTSNNSAAAGWGSSMDMSSIPSWAYDTFVENVMYTRNFLAMNPDTLKSDGSIDLGAGSASLMFPQDLNTLLDASSSASSVPAATSAVSSSGSAATSSTSTTSGARGVTASFGLASIVAFGAAFFAL